MPGIDRATGRVIGEATHIGQSVADILTTPVGSRVMRRDYGSHLFDLIDAPGNAVGVMRVIAAAADALARWEPRLRLRSATVTPAADGRAVLSVTCQVRATGDILTTDVALSS